MHRKLNMQINIILLIATLEYFYRHGKVAYTIKRKLEFQENLLGIHYRMWTN